MLFRSNEERAGKLIAEKLGNAADEAVGLFREAYPERRIQDLLFTDRVFRPGTFDYLKARADAGLKNTYVYLFKMEQPVYGGTLPWHNAEIPYVFRNADYIEPSYVPEITEKMQDINRSISNSLAGIASPPRMAESAGAAGGRNYTYGDINLYIDKVNNADGRDVQRMMREMEFFRRQQSAARGG